jgi:hypothetical protein
MSRRWILLAALVLVIAGGIPVAVRLLTTSSNPADRCPAAGANTAGPVSTSSVAAEDYWTPERMRNASGAPRPDEGGTPEDCSP